MNETQKKTKKLLSILGEDSPIRKYRDGILFAVLTMTAIVLILVALGIYGSMKEKLKREERIRKHRESQIQ